MLRSILTGRFDPAAAGRIRRVPRHRCGPGTPPKASRHRPGPGRTVPRPDPTARRRGPRPAVRPPATQLAHNRRSHPNPTSQCPPPRRRPRRSCPGVLSSPRSSRAGVAFFRSLAQIGRQVAGGLAYAHARGIVHRDIKPSNLLLDTEGVVWIADFGLAKGDDEGLTHSGDILGTLRYMAPERFRGEGDARADVYALGLTLYELLTLQPGLRVVGPAQADRADQDRGAAAAPVDRRPDPAGPGDDRPEGDREGPEARYQTAEAMAEDLGRFLADEPIKARQVERRGAILAVGPAQPSDRRAGRSADGGSGLGDGRLAYRRTEHGPPGGERQRERNMVASDADLARDAARKNGGEAIAARDVAKQARNAAARQAAGLLLDRGIEDAHSGEPALALHLFVRHSEPSPAGDLLAARSNGRSGRTCPPGPRPCRPWSTSGRAGPTSTDGRLHSRRRRDRHGHCEDEIQSSGPTPAGRSARRSRYPSGRVRRCGSPPTAGASGSRRPPSEEGRRRVGHAPPRPGVGPPDPAADPDHRAGPSI